MEYSFNDFDFVVENCRNGNGLCFPTYENPLMMPLQPYIDYEALNLAVVELCEGYF